MGWGARWSPNGEWIAFLFQRNEFNQIWLVRPDGQDLHQLTDYDRDIYDLAWSPDGTRLVCAVNRGGRRELVVVDMQNGQSPNYAAEMVSSLVPGIGRQTVGDITVKMRKFPMQPPDIYRVETADGKMIPLTFSDPPAWHAFRKLCQKKWYIKAPMDWKSPPYFSDTKNQTVQHW